MQTPPCDAPCEVESATQFVYYYTIMPQGDSIDSVYAYTSEQRAMREAQDHLGSHPDVDITGHTWRQGLDVLPHLLAMHGHNTPMTKIFCGPDPLKLARAYIVRLEVKGADIRA